MTARTTKPKDIPSTAPEEVIDVEARHEAELNEEELLKDLPELRTPMQMRQRHRSRLTRIFLSMSDDNGDIDTGHLTEDEMLGLLDQLDDFFESIAKDSAEYDKWASGPLGSEDKLLALMSRYMRALGE